MKTLFDKKVNIWRGADRPSGAIVDRAVAADRKEALEKAKSLSGGPVQLILTKGAKGKYRESSVYGLQGCIDAVLATYRRRSGKGITMWALAESLIVDNSDKEVDSLYKMMRQLNDGMVVNVQSAEEVACLLGVPLLDLVGTLGNEIGYRLIEEERRSREEELRSYRLNVVRVTPDTESVNALADALLGDRTYIPQLDLHDGFFLPGDLPGLESANKALDTFRQVMEIWKADKNPNSDERGRVSQSIERLAKHGIHLYMARALKLHRRGNPEDCEGGTQRHLVLRFSQEDNICSVPYPRADEVEIWLADDKEAKAEALADLDWAGLEDLV